MNGSVVAMHSTSSVAIFQELWERTRIMFNVLRKFHQEESGQDLIEYALIGLLIALGAIAGMGTVASSINAEFTKISGELT
jgi:pilus assembly protein Flp/PilA